MHGPAFSAAWGKQTALSPQVHLQAQLGLGGWQKQWEMWPLRWVVRPEPTPGSRDTLPLGHSCGLATRKVTLSNWLFGGQSHVGRHLLSSRAGVNLHVSCVPIQL